MFNNLSLSDTIGFKHISSVYVSLSVSFSEQGHTLLSLLFWADGSPGINNKDCSFSNE